MPAVLALVAERDIEMGRDNRHNQDDGTPLSPMVDHMVHRYDGMLTDLEVEKVAEKAAEVAIFKMWFRMGYDLNDIDSVNQLQADLGHSRKMRQREEKLAGWIFKAIATSIITGALAIAVAAIWQYFKHSVGFKES